MKALTLSERALVIAPRGRDAAIAVAMLAEAGIEAAACATLAGLLDELDRGAAFVVMTEEAIATADLHALSAWLEDQEEWSDLPFVLLTSRGGGLERNPAAARHLEVLGNVTFLERPFHPTTLISLGRAALRARRRQYDARSRLLALHESEARYRSLFDTIDEGFCVIEFLDGAEGPLSDYVHVEANAAYTVNAGIPDIVGKRLREIVSPSEADAWARIYRDVLVTGEPIRFERELVETGRHLELAAFRIGPPERRQVAVLFRDMTARKRAEAELHHLNQTLEVRVAEALAERRVLADVIDGTDIFVQVADRDFNWLAINNAAANEFARIFDVPRPRAGDNMLAALEHRPAHRDAVRAVWSRALGGEEFVETEEFGDPALDRRYYEMRFRTLRDPTGAPVGAYQFVSDVTERLREQARLREAEEALRQSQKVEAMGQLTGGVAHDFNNLLTPIVGALDMLQRKGLGSEREQRLIGGAAQSAERAKLLVQRLLAFARRQPLQPTSVDVTKVVHGMSDLVASTTGPQIRTIVEIADDLPAARADQNQLEMALLNLAVNARDAMAGGGTLRISATVEQVEEGGAPPLRPGRYVRLSVADTGVGMDQATLDRAIEPFFSTKGVGKGTGLGLSMVHGLASQLGGALTISSEPGLGTNVELWLPESVEHIQEPSQKTPAAAVAARGIALLVDDEEFVRLSTADMLVDLGYEVLEAGTAEAGLAIVRSGAAFDLLVTDHLMPGMTGSDLAREVQAMRPGVPVLVISGYAESEGLEPDLPRLTKPFRKDELAECLASFGSASDDPNVSSC